jgi:hypothetical protein
VETSTSLEEHFMTDNIEFRKFDAPTVHDLQSAERDRKRIEKARVDGTLVCTEDQADAMASLPEYTGTTDSDRAEYLRANSHELATQAVAAAREKIGGRNLAVEADAYANQRALERANQLITDPDSVMNAARPECNDTTSKENAKRVGQEILGARHVHDFLSDSEGSFEGISPGFLMTIADKMTATREERVGAAVDEAWPTEEDLDEVDRMQAEYYETPVEEV